MIHFALHFATTSVFTAMLKKMVIMVIALFGMFMGVHERNSDVRFIIHSLLDLFNESKDSDHKTSLNDSFTNQAHANLSLTPVTVVFSE